MARKPRCAVGDVGTFHVYNRGNNSQKIFHDDEDFEYFRHLLARAKKSFDINLFYYALMPNHYHLLLEAIKNGDLSKAMKIIDQKYSLWHKNKYGGHGQLWQGRFKNKLIEDEIYFMVCSSYIELNPVKDGLCSKPENYRWTSYIGHTESQKDFLINLDHQYLSRGRNTQERHEEHRKFIKYRMEMGCLTGYELESKLVEFG